MSATNDFHESLSEEILRRDSVPALPIFLLCPTSPSSLIHQLYVRALEYVNYIRSVATHVIGMNEFIFGISFFVVCNLQLTIPGLISFKRLAAAFAFSLPPASVSS